MLEANQILTEVNTECSNLCFLKNDLKDFITTNNAILTREEPSSNLIQSIFASIKFSNSTQIYNSPSIIKAFLSTVTFEDSSISSIEVVDSSIEIVSSEFNFSNMTVSGVTNQNDHYFIVVSLESQFMIKNTVFKDSTTMLFSHRSSAIDMKNLTFANVTEARYLFELYDSTEATIDTLVTQNSKSTSNSLISIKDSSNVIIKNTKHSSINQTVYSIYRSTITQISNFEIESTQGIYVEDCTIQNMTSSQFISNAQALYLYNSDVSIHSSTFTNNTSTVGAAIYFS
jgi:hypothetical protein